MAEDIKFKVELQDGVSAPAHKAAQAVDDLSNEMAKGAKASAGLGQGLVKVQDPAAVAHRALDGVTSGVKGMVGAFLGGNAKGVIGGATEALAGLAGALDIVAPGAGAVASAAVKAVGGIAAMGVGVFETAMKANAAKAQWTATFDALGQGPDAGKKTLAMLSDLGRELPQSGQQIKEWAREAAKMGITDLGEMRQEILATASAQAILGEEGAGSYQRISRKVQDAIEGNHSLTIASKELTKTIGSNIAADVAGRMGLTLEKLETGLKAGTVDARKFGVALEDAFISKGKKGLEALWLSNLWTKIESAGKGLFTGIDTAPITDGLRNLLGILDQNSASGQGLKTSMTDAFNGIAKAIGWSINEAVVFFLELEIAALSARLTVMSVTNDIANFLGRKGLLGSRQEEKALAQNADTDRQDRAYKQQKAAGLVDEYALGDDGKWEAVGKGVGDGLIKGMDASVPGVTAAGERLGAATVAGTRAGAGVHSPSLPAMEVGGYVGQGMEIGMDRGGPGVARAGRQLSTNALGGMVGAALTSPAANGNGGGQGLTITIGQITIQAPQGVTDATQLSATGLSVALERFQLGSGR